MGLNKYQCKIPDFGTGLQKTINKVKYLSLPLLLPQLHAYSGVDKKIQTVRVAASAAQITQPYHFAQSWS